jgi:uncharacterized protein
MTHVLVLPGWQSSGPAHWQSRWEALHGYERVQQHDWLRPLRGDWVARLEDVLLSKTELPAQISPGPAASLMHKNATPAPVVLVAHSLGCHLVAAWAAASRHKVRVRGALLVAPPDLAREDLPTELHNWRRSVLRPLPFAARCVLSSNDPFASLAAGRHMATAWGAQIIEAGDLGHINGDSGLGDWPQGHAWLQALL